MGFDAMFFGRQDSKETDLRIERQELQWI